MPLRQKPPSRSQIIGRLPCLFAMGAHEYTVSLFHNLDKYQIEFTVVKDLASAQWPILFVVRVGILLLLLQFGWWDCFLSESWNVCLKRLKVIIINTTIVVLRDVHCGHLFAWFCNTLIHCLPMLFLVNMRSCDLCKQCIHFCSTKRPFKHCKYFWHHHNFNMSCTHTHTHTYSHIHTVHCPLNLLLFFQHKALFPCVKKISRPDTRNVN